MKSHHPRTNTFQTCGLLNIQCMSNPNDKVSKAKLQLHHRRAENVMKIIKVHVISQFPLSAVSMNLQQVLSLLTRNQMYYLRQFSCYNLGVHVSETNKSHIFLWHDGISGEVATKLHHVYGKELKMETQESKS